MPLTFQLPQVRLETGTRVNAVRSSINPGVFAVAVVCSVFNMSAQ